MGTVFSFDVRGGDPRRTEPALEAAVAWLRHVDEVFSTYRPDSQVSRLAAGTLALADCLPEVREVHLLCARAYERTDGWFSAGYAGGFDPTGLVKGWAIERAADLLAEAGAEAVCVNGGGDVQVQGGPWHIGVSDPLRRGELAAVVPAEGRMAVATSGPAERGAHIVDPATGRPAPPELASVTVVGPSLTDADVSATAACAMGRRALFWLAAETATEAFVVLPDGATWHSAGFAAARAPLA
ncbi:FAD:protein FMN transferase [Actinacidiphila acididurans]|uniref:FAD:protein FMN transferase n=1 Tax=Actinacidiphila acididurans TaxID=2784346 RepID=A0ABS2TM11_9ACTN|nr:FAD:protein FMN transferase [Actinacidiphila acididurans]MBM9503285.1 FAD:protein FMN transferase [Actinacidiphila acididurans]